MTAAKKVLLAAPRGYCAGVDRAVETVEKALELYGAPVPITDEALALPVLPKVIWMQLSVRNDEAAVRAEARGVEVIMNRSPKIEYGRISGEIGWQGINSRILSSKKPVLSSKGFQKLTIAPRGPVRHD